MADYDQFAAEYHALIVRRAPVIESAYQFVLQQLAEVRCATAASSRTKASGGGPTG